MQIISYLTFNGNCREAMKFYQKCFGGELTFQTLGQSPLALKMPRRMKNAIIHSTLTYGNLVLMASDMPAEKNLTKGNSVSLMLNLNSESEIKSTYKKLAKGGKKNFELQSTFFSSLFGELTDKYGNNWLLNLPVRK